jgi:lipoprotein NlpI
MNPLIRAGIGLALILITAQALAAAYDDFNAGVAQLTRGGYDGAIVSFTRALDAGDLTAGLKPVAYLDRAYANAATKHTDEAFADAASALALKPDYVEAYLLRARLYMGEGRLAEASAEYDSAIRAKPDRDDLYRARGTARWEQAKFADAASDFAQASKLSSTDAYIVIWQTISAGRTAPIDQEALRETARGLDLFKWPGPVVKLFEARMSPEEVQRAAARADVPAQLRPDCEADFYIAEWHLLKDELPEAKQLLQAAISNCPHNFVEYHAAQVELTRTPFP